MNAPLWCRLGALAVIGLSALLASTAQASSTLRCESSDGRWKACPVDTAGGVTLTRQLSSAGCWQGDTWGFDRNRIWVTNGCRAEFRIGSTGSNNSSSDGGKVAGALILGAIAGAIIAGHNDDDNHQQRPQDCGPRGCGNWGGGRERHFTCESKNGRMAWCKQTVGRRERIDMTRQLSRGDCQFGRTWGVDRGEVWVDRGCRAEFVIY